MTEPVEIPIDGELDLHTIPPGEVKALVPIYLEECHARGIRQVRLIHGKGTGTLRRIVQAALERSPLVIRYRLAEDSGGWGATVAELIPPPEPAGSPPPSDRPPATPRDSGSD